MLSYLPVETASLGSAEAAIYVHYDSNSHESQISLSC